MKKQPVKLAERKEVEMPGAKGKMTKGKGKGKKGC